MLFKDFVHLNAKQYFFLKFGYKNNKCFVLKCTSLLLFKAYFAILPVGHEKNRKCNQGII